MEDNKSFTTVEKLNKRCDEKYLNLIKQGNFKSILNTIGKFDKETIENDILILEQMPEATQLYTKAEWEKIKHRNLIESPKFVEVIGLTLYKNEQGPIDNKGSMHIIGTNKLHTFVRTLYDISQTTGQETEKKFDKETLAEHFDNVKHSLEHNLKGYTFKYDSNLESNSKIDKEEKIITIKDGLSLNEVITELIDNTAKVLIENRRTEGIAPEKQKNIIDIENNSAIYALHSRYGLDKSNYDFREIEKLSDEDLIKFRENLNKVRSVVYQITHNLENSIEFAMRGLDNEKTQNQTDKKTYQNYKQNQNEGGQL